MLIQLSVTLIVDTHVAWGPDGMSQGITPVLTRTDMLQEAHVGDIAGKVFKLINFTYDTYHFNIVILTSMKLVIPLHLIS